MRFALFLCLCITVLHVLVQGDHHKDHNEKSHHHHGSEKHDHAHHDHKNVTCHKIAAGNADFAFRLYHQIASAGVPTNIFYSPLSISTAFGMLSLASGSQTFSEIIETLGFNLTLLTEKEMHQSFHHMLEMLNEADSELQLSIENALFIQEGFKVLAEFLEDMKYYESEAFTIDFNNTIEAIKQINDYVEKQTHGKIVDLLKELDPRTSLLLLNCIYFKGKWKRPFDPSRTKEEDFHVDENTVVQVPMMVRSGMYDMLYDEELHCTVVRMPYKGDASAILVLPDDGKLKQVEDALSVSTAKKWTSNLRRTSVDLHIPKLSISTTLDLKEILSKMGIHEVFTDAADLSKITGHRDLKVSKAVHKAVLSIDETGTEAAGVTTIEIMPMSLPSSVIYNRPYLMLIFENSINSPLFMGKIVNPTAQ